MDEIKKLSDLKIDSNVINEINNYYLHFLLLISSYNDFTKTIIHDVKFEKKGMSTVFDTIFTETFCFCNQMGTYNLNYYVI